MNEDFFEKPGDITQQMRDGLARAYKDEGFRKYLVHAIRTANHNVLASLDTDKSDLAREYSFRLKALRKMLTDAFMCYEAGELLRKKK